MRYKVLSLHWTWSIEIQNDRSDGSFRDWKGKTEKKRKRKRNQAGTKKNTRDKEDLKEVVLRQKNTTEARCTRNGIYCETTLKETEEAYLENLKDMEIKINKNTPILHYAYIYIKL